MHRIYLKFKLGLSSEMDGSRDLVRRICLVLRLKTLGVSKQMKNKLLYYILGVCGWYLYIYIYVQIWYIYHMYIYIYIFDIEFVVGCNPRTTRDRSSAEMLLGAASLADELRRAGVVQLWGTNWSQPTESYWLILDALYIICRNNRNIPNYT